MHRHDHKEREPKAFPQYDDAAHIDSAAVAELPSRHASRKAIPKQRPTRRNTARSSTNNKRRNDTNRSAVWR